MKDENQNAIDMTEDQMSATGSGVASFLNYYLQNIETYNALMEEDSEDNPAMLNYLEHCQKNLSKAKKVSTLLNNMGTFIGSELEQVNLLDFFTEALEKFSKINDHCQYHFEKPDEALHIFADSASLKDIVYNLFRLLKNCSNMYIKICNIDIKEDFLDLKKSSLESGQYTVITISDSESAQIEEMSRIVHEEGIFKDEFLSSENMISYGKILSLKGDLLAKKDDSSTQLAVLLPKEESQDRSLFNNETLKGNETIMVVDDEDMIWNVLINGLQDMGYTVILAEHGKDAVDIYKENPGSIDLVILDMLMPEMNGKEAFFEIQKNDPNVKVLLSSGYMAEEDAQDVLDAGAKDFLQKPYKMVDLAKLIRKILNDK